MIQPRTNLPFKPSSLIDWAYFGNIFLSIITGHRLNTRWDYETGNTGVMAHRFDDGQHYWASYFLGLFLAC